MESRLYRVPGMSCVHCVSAVEAEVAGIEGVEAVEVDLETKQVTVRGPAFDDDAVRAAIVEAGYEAPA